MPKTCNALYFLEEKCMTCNVYMDGNYINYTLYMIDMYGRDEVERIKKIKGDKLKISKADYADMIEDYKTRLEDLL